MIVYLIVGLGEAWIRVSDQAAARDFELLQVVSDVITHTHQH